MRGKRKQSASVKVSHDRIVNVVTGIRESNNFLWMEILRIALKKSPRKVRKILNQISKNDRDVTSWLERV
jgi:hypothetical protein